MEDYFLIFLLVLCFSSIIYFNSIAAINYNKSFELDILNTEVKCVYKNLKTADYCPNTKENLCDPTKTYILGSTPVIFTEVCSSICNPVVGSTKCSSTILDAKFQACLKYLKPQNCTAVANALAIDKLSNQLYAQTIFQ